MTTLATRNTQDTTTEGASIIGSATLCFSRWTQRRGRQLHCVQNRRKH
jgi:hypothetical protein